MSVLQMDPYLTRADRRDKQKEYPPENLWGGRQLLMVRLICARLIVSERLYRNSGNVAIGFFQSESGTHRDRRLTRRQKIARY